MEKVEEAVKDFEKSVSLSPSFAVAHVQKCYTGWSLFLSVLFIFGCSVHDKVRFYKFQCDLLLVFLQIISVIV